MPPSSCRFIINSEIRKKVAAVVVTGCISRSDLQLEILSLASAASRKRHRGTLRLIPGPLPTLQGLPPTLSLREFDVADEGTRVAQNTN